MSLDNGGLYTLLPAIYRIRDAEQGYPLRALLSIIEEQVAVVQADLAQLYDDQFIETCAEWAVPYIGDLVGARGLYELSDIVSQRPQVANTLAYRRRKGTVGVVEQLARDVTGWRARAVEYFPLLTTTQYMNHVRPDNKGTAGLHAWVPLERVDSPFDTIPHTADVRRIESGRGSHNIPNVGVFLWRLNSYSLQMSPAAGVNPSPADHRFRFNPLGTATPLWSKPVPEPENRITHIVEPHNVPERISRRALHERLAELYGPGKSMLLNVGGVDVPITQIVVGDLSDRGTEWAHQPESRYCIDPELGRIATPGNQPVPADLRITYHYGFGADIGGGEYDRAGSFNTDLDPVLQVAAPETIQSALSACTAGGVVEITDNSRYPETAAISVDAGGRLELRGSDERRPVLALAGPLKITGGEGAEVTLNGLVITGGPLVVDATAANGLRLLRLRHCTLPPQETEPSLIVRAPNVVVEVDRCIIGGLRVVDGSRVVITDSIVDATAETRVALAATDDGGAGGALRVENSTVIGKIWTAELDLASNTLFLALADAEDIWPAPLVSERRQAGCVRFSYVPPGSRTPRRYRCQPASGADPVPMRPQLDSWQYGDPEYCQLTRVCAPEIRRGADDEGEMGVYHHLHQPQRETNLRVRLDEYLRFGLEAGISYAT
ncbi:MAG: hypothetical protein H0V86_07680 [Chloroflexia bacterium]|nr:hypothetical protein [Chloroflexia bacterium]